MLTFAQSLRYEGRVHADYLVLETDESHVPVVYSKLNLQTLVLLNFFRDQLDRNGEVETLILKVKSSLKHLRATLFSMPMTKRGKTWTC